MKSPLITILPAAALGMVLNLAAAPMQPLDLQLRATMDVGTDIGGVQSVFNPIYCGDIVYADQINSPAFGRYFSGWDSMDLGVDNRVPPLATPLEHRMVMAFPGALRNTYIMGSSAGLSGSTTLTFSRYNYDGTERVDANTPGGVMAEGFDFVDDNTVIYTSYTSGTRTRLYLAHVVAEPFALTTDTRWNANGYVSTTAGTRIRNVRVGDKYKTFAYYGDAGQNTDPKFFALNLATGQETVLGNAGSLSGGGSFGVWTVVERGGYLYVQTTDNGIFVYNMVNATTLGELYATYAKSELDLVTGQSNQYWGFDASSDGKKFLLGGLGKLFEFGAPNLKFSVDTSNATLAWPISVTAVAVQSATALTPSGFADVDPQPAVYQDGKTNLVQVPVTVGSSLFRLRRNP